MYQTCRLAAKKMKKKDLAAVDHSQIKYELFRKDFYIEPPEYRELTPDQVDLMRIELDGIKIRVCMLIQCFAAVHFAMVRKDHRLTNLM